MIELAVLGGGSWGTTLAHLGAVAGGRVRLWLRDGDTVREIHERRTNRRYTGAVSLADTIVATDDLGAAVRGARLVLVAVPSHAARDVIRTLGGLALGDQIVVHAIKGLEVETGQPISRIFREETAIRKLGVLSGPNIAPEILAGLPAATVVASHYPEVVEVAQGALMNPRFRVYANDDVIGVELGGALKNIIAIAAGIVSGLGLGENARGLLMTRGLAEVARFAVHHGAQLLTLAGLAGMGDLVVTCSSVHSRNFRVGQGLAAGRPLPDILRELGMVAEGVRTTRTVHRVAQRESLYMPITAALARVLDGDLDVRQALAGLMEQPARAEVDADRVALR